MRLADYDLDGSHTTVVLFVGPQADELSKKWRLLVRELEENEESEDCLDINTDTAKVIEKFVASQKA